MTSTAHLAVDFVERDTYPGEGLRSLNHKRGFDSF